MSNAKQVNESMSKLLLSHLYENIFFKSNKSFGVIDKKLLVIRFGETNSHDWIDKSNRLHNLFLIVVIVDNLIY